MDVSDVVPGATLVCVAVLFEHVFPVPDGAAGDLYDFGPGGDTPDRTVHGQCASHDEVSDSWVWGQGILVESWTLQYEGARVDFHIR